MEWTSTQAKLGWRALPIYEKERAGQLRPSLTAAIMAAMRLLTLAAVIVCLPLAAQTPAWPPSSDHLTLPLWPNGAPGGSSAPTPERGPEGDMTTAKDGRPGGRSVIRIGNVSSPTLTVFTPKTRNSGAAVVVFPGGGYKILAIDLEGTEVCDWLNGIGVTCIVVKYRVPDTGPYPKASAPLQDAQRALGLVRQNADQWHIDPNRVGVLGFSAGAHLAAALSTHFDKRLYDPIDAADKLSCRPDFAAIIYPGYLRRGETGAAPTPDLMPTAQTPPTFLLQAEDDPVHVENAIAYFMALKEAKAPAELHIYAQGGHGYGLRPTDLPVTGWPRLAEIWMHTINMLPSTGGQP